MPNQPQVLVVIADGSEEMEVVIAIDILRRAQIEVRVASVMDQCLITASRGVKIEADCLLDACINQCWDMIVLPGGLPGAEHLSRNHLLMQLIQDQAASARWLAAICAAPAVVLGRSGLLKHHRATVFPAFYEELRTQAKSVTQAPVVIDSPFITSQGPGTAMAFALTLVACLRDQHTAQTIANAMVFKGFNEGVL